ncbi:hypothetical protein EAI_11810, partial [Harpegnathos saltator]
RNFFNPNFCHFCKGKLKLRENNTCSSCNITFYCSNNHESEDNENHNDICKILKKISCNYPEYWQTHNLKQENWISSRKNLLRLVKYKLPRDMMPHEIQMIMFTKSCSICREQSNLQTCMECYCVHYCSYHPEVLKNHHSSNCAKLKLCLQVDMILTYIGFKQNKIPDLTSSMLASKSRYIVNMQRFLEIFTNYDIDIDYVRFQFYSDYLSGPLTLYYGMKSKNLHIKSSHYVVLIIAATVLDAQYILAWEILLHLLSDTLKHLKVILIGSKI